MANVMQLLSVTKGKHIIFTSGAAGALDLRGPCDVLNLATCLGMTPSAAAAVLDRNAVQMLYHAATRKCTFKAAVSVEPRDSPFGTKPTDFLAMDFISFADTSHA